MRRADGSGDTAANDDGGGNAGTATDNKDGDTAAAPPTASAALVAAASACDAAEAALLGPDGRAPKGQERCEAAAQAELSPCATHTRVAARAKVLP